MSKIKKFRKINLKMKTIMIINQGRQQKIGNKKGNLNVNKKKIKQRIKMNKMVE